MRLILASASPRRRILLESVGIKPVVIPAGVEEEAMSAGEPDVLAKDLAERKVRAVARAHPEELVLGADTLVVIDGEVLGKPGDMQDAVRMLERLSGKTHRVYTGVALYCPVTCGILRDCDCTSVTMRDLTVQEIMWYVNTGEPMDKAGGYALQGAGAFFVKEIRGDYSSVIGLPLPKVYALLQGAGISPENLLQP